MSDDARRAAEAALRDLERSADEEREERLRVERDELKVELDRAREELRRREDG